MANIFTLEINQATEVSLMVYVASKGLLLHGLSLTTDLLRKCNESAFVTNGVFGQNAHPTKNVYMIFPLSTQVLTIHEDAPNRKPGVKRNLTQVHRILYLYGSLLRST